MNRSTSSQENISGLRKRLSKQNLNDIMIKKVDSNNSIKKVRSKCEIRKVISKDDYEKLIDNELENNPFYFF